MQEIHIARVPRGPAGRAWVRLTANTVPTSLPPGGKVRILGSPRQQRLRPEEPATVQLVFWLSSGPEILLRF